MAASASVAMPRPQNRSPSQYPISADTRSTSVWSMNPMPPTASSSTAMANAVSGMSSWTWRMNRRASRFVYGCGNRSRKFSQILRLSAWVTMASASDARHERTSQVLSVSFINRRSAGPCFEQQRVQIERSGHRDVQGTVSAARPLIEWAIAGELHAVSVGVGEIDRFADAVIGDAVEPDAGFTQTFDSRCKAAAIGIADRQMVQARVPLSRRRAAAAEPCVQRDVMVIVAGREKRGAVVGQAQNEIEAENVLVERERAIEIGHLQMNMPDARTSRDAVLAGTRRHPAIVTGVQSERDGGQTNHVQRRGRREELLKNFSACSASSRLRSAWFSPSFGEARRPASAKATAVRRSFSEGGSASGAKAAAFNVASGPAVVKTNARTKPPLGHRFPGTAVAP